MGEAIGPAEVGALYSYPDCEPDIDVIPVFALCVGDFPEFRDCSEGFLESWVFTETKLDRDVSVCS